MFSQRSWNMIQPTKRDTFTEDTMRFKKKKKKKKSLTKDTWCRWIVYFEEESLKSVAKIALSIFQR